MKVPFEIKAPQVWSKEIKASNSSKDCVKSEHSSAEADVLSSSRICSSPDKSDFSSEPESVSGDAVEKCHQLKKIWDPTNCECICPPDASQICSTGSYFHNELCRCVPSHGKHPEYGGKRRRPPPV
ncbi:hypothetical protein NPIL_91301 [Nephila pilipes]|uniref:Uncharacterized protein n=1 Tax=Nephila pilipes TaxID=299642 RepID=A0A8X6TPC0_NEPPI|nr:hypothetical protein NPIL_91301 [Nephila pilipes]